MITYHSKVTINRPVEQVFRVAADLTRYSEWMDVSTSRLLTEGEARLGARGEVTMTKGPMKKPLAYEITEWTPNQKYAFRTLPGGPISWEGSFAFEAAGDSSTHVTGTGKVQLGGLLRLLEFLMAGEVRSNEQAELERLKKVVEAGN